MCIESCLNDQELPWHIFYLYISSAFNEKSKKNRQYNGQKKKGQKN